MLIERIIEFQSRGPGAPGRTCTPTTVCFHDKTNISQGKFSRGLLFTAKILQEQCALLSTIQ